MLYQSTLDHTNTFSASCISTRTHQRPHRLIHNNNNNMYLNIFLICEIQEYGIQLQELMLYMYNQSARGRGSEVGVLPWHAHTKNYFLL